VVFVKLHRFSFKRFQWLCNAAYRASKQEKQVNTKNNKQRRGDRNTIWLNITAWLISDLYCVVVGNILKAISL
jgi:hypothetical protein